MRLFFCFAFGAILGRGVAAGPTPLKLEVSAQKRTIAAGESLPVEVRLLSETNQPVGAPKPLAVTLQARSASGKIDALQTVQIEANQSSKSVTITPPGSGLIYLWAKNPQLLPGGVYIRVRGAAVEPSAGPPPRASIARIALRYSPDRSFLADGKDAATVEAFLLSGDAAAADVRLNLFDSSGAMQPAPLTIAKGQASGRSTLTYGQPGTVTVEFFGASPPAECEGDKKLAIQFIPPVTRLTLAASPPKITLVDTAQLFATLTDEQGRSIATAAPRDVVFSIGSGLGQIAETEVQIAAGQSQAHTTFRPERSGTVSVSASTANLFPESAPVQVTPPVSLLLWSALGGSVGGLFSYWNNRRRSRRRVAIGLVTGFILYWLCLFLGLASVGRGVLLNPLSAFALSTLGGWLQTEVFTALWAAIGPKGRA